MDFFSKTSFFFLITYESLKLKIRYIKAFLYFKNLPSLGEINLNSFRREIPKKPEHVNVHDKIVF